MTIKNQVKTIWQTLCSYLFTLISYINIPAMIYDYLFSRLLTRQTYQFMFRNNIEAIKSKINTVLDIGVGTGFALNSIIDQFEQRKIVGIDIDRNYLKKAKTLFMARNNVEIREQNLYDLAASSERYDLILFSSSFMIMPDKARALEVAKTLLNKNGKIIFLLTLYDKSRKFTLMEKLKPTLKYYTTVDFGNLVYESDMVSLLESNNLTITKKTRVYHKLNPLFYIFRFFCVECEIKAQ